MSIERSHLCGGGLAMVLACAAAACGGSHAPARAPATASARATGPASKPVPSLRESPGATEEQNGPGGNEPNAEQNQPNGGQGPQGEQGDAELVVSRDVVAKCPTLRLVRKHVEELDPDMVWLAVLESIGDCMSEGGPMARQSLGVSGDEEHRRVVREVLGTRGIAPERVVARPTSRRGAAECQGGEACDKLVEITIVEVE